MKRKKGGVLLAAGCVLLAAALGLTIFNLLDERRADRQAAETVQKLEKIIPDRGEQDTSVTTAQQTQTVSVDGGKYIGMLKIPELSLTLPVNAEWSYPLLRKAPCRYQGSVQGKNLIIAGHNYKRHFGSLKLLKAGDAVVFTDTDGFVYRYTVTEVDTLAGSDVQDMKKGTWDLTLFTCTIGGKKRVTVRCALESA